MQTEESAILGPDLTQGVKIANKIVNTAARQNLKSLVQGNAITVKAKDSALMLPTVYPHLFKLFLSPFIDPEGVECL